MGHSGCRSASARGRALARFRFECRGRRTGCRPWTHTGAQRCKTQIRDAQSTGEWNGAHPGAYLGRRAASARDGGHSFQRNRATPMNLLFRPILYPAMKALRLFFAIFLLSPCSAGAANEELLIKAQSLSGRARENILVAGARREGEVADYTSTNHQMSGPLVKLFEKKYPFITVKLSRIGGAKIIQRAETEAKAGLHAVDIIGTGELGIVSLIDRGFMAKYVSPMRESLREGFADKEGLWTVQHATLLFAAYNRKLVKADEVPRSWEEFLDPKWKGK